MRFYKVFFPSNIDNMSWYFYVDSNNTVFPNPIKKRVITFSRGCNHPYCHNSLTSTLPAKRILHIQKVHYNINGNILLLKALYDLVVKTT